MEQGLESHRQSSRRVLLLQDVHHYSAMGSEADKARDNTAMREGESEIGFMKSKHSSG